MRIIQRIPKTARITFGLVTITPKALKVSYNSFSSTSCTNPPKADFINYTNLETHNMTFNRKKIFLYQTNCSHAIYF